MAVPDRAGCYDLTSWQHRSGLYGRSRNSHRSCYFCRNLVTEAAIPGLALERHTGEERHARVYVDNDFTLGVVRANLPRERRVQPAPTSCYKCGGDNLHKLGEDVTETLERVPAHWKVVENVREKFSCRDCDSMTQPPAPSHPTTAAQTAVLLLACTRALCAG
jgi:transposase